MYPEKVVSNVREETQSIGLEEIKNPEEVSEKLKNCLLLVTSVCGCTASTAIPAVYEVLQSENVKGYSVFAGVDKETTEKARELIGEEPSSPSIAIFKDGKKTFFIPREEIQGQDPSDIAERIREKLSK